MKSSQLACSLSLCAALLAPAAHAQQAASAEPASATNAPLDFLQQQQVQQFIDRMVATHGFDRGNLDALFGDARYAERVIKLVMPAPPGQPKNWQAYRARFVEPVRIQGGVAFWNAHAEALERAQQQYGVPPEIIVAIIGIETVYGRYTGNFRVVDVLATLGFDYPDLPNREARMRFFRGELENTLLYAREAGVDPMSLLGSYAGAIGWPQFMPGSIRRWAVDFDGNGRIDLRNSPVDAIGSVASFLAAHGWTRGEPLAFPATVAHGEGAPAWETFLDHGLQARFTLAELEAAGIRPTVAAPNDMRYGLVDLQNGLEATEYWLGTGNFFAITRYNRSYFYAMSVVDLARAVRTARAY